MKEKIIINEYISILKAKEEYFENMNKIYDLLEKKSFLLVKKIKYRNNLKEKERIIKKEQEIIEKIKIIKDKNKEIEENSDFSRSFNVGFMELKENNLLINDRIVFLGELIKEDQEIYFYQNKVGSFDKEEIFDLEILYEDKKLNFLLINEAFYDSIDKEKLKKYNYIIYRGEDSKRCIKNFKNLITIELKKEKGKTKVLRRVYDKY